VATAGKDRLLLENWPDIVRALPHVRHGRVVAKFICGLDHTRMVPICQPSSSMSMRREQHNRGHSVMYNKGLEKSCPRSATHASYKELIKTVWHYAIRWATIPMMVRLNSSSQARSKTNPALVRTRRPRTGFLPEIYQKFPGIMGVFICDPVRVRSGIEPAIS
jgi:hypothetical protein